MDTSLGYDTGNIEDFILHTGQARRGPKLSGMSDRDSIVPRRGSIGMRTA